MPHDHILVVDDERDILELVKYNLEKEGYRVTTVATGEDALSRHGTKLPDLVVLDLMLPGVDGLEVCRRLKSDAEDDRHPHRDAHGQGRLRRTSSPGSSSAPPTT